MGRISALRQLIRWTVAGMLSAAGVLLLLAGLATRVLAPTVLGGGLLLVGLLIGDAWRLRKRTPLLNSSDPRQVRKGWALLVVLLVFSPIMAAMLSPSVTPPARQPTTQAVAVSPESAPTVAPPEAAPTAEPTVPLDLETPPASPSTDESVVETPLTLEEAVQAVARRRFGDRLRAVEIFETAGRTAAMAIGYGPTEPWPPDAPTKTYARVSYALGTVWDASDAVNRVAVDWTDLARDVFRLDGVEHLELVALMPFRDVRGWEHEETGAVYSMSRKTAETLNWAGMRHRDWPRLLRNSPGAEEGIWYHPALRREWEAFQRGR